MNHKQKLWKKIREGRGITSSEILLTQDVFSAVYDSMKRRINHIKKIVLDDKEGDYDLIQWKLKKYLKEDEE